MPFVESPPKRFCGRLRKNGTSIASSARPAAKRELSPGVVEIKPMISSRMPTGQKLDARFRGHERTIV
jgi:hypothetical protein